MSKKITINGSNLLEDLTDDWGGQNNGSSSTEVYGTPVPAGAEWGVNRGEVERFIKAQFKGKAGEFYFDADTSKYLVFADTADRDLYLTDREEYSDLLIGTFDAPANYTAEITMVTPSSNTILKGATGNYIDFTFDVKTKTGSSTGEAVIATFAFNNAGNIIKETRIYDAGTNVHFLVDEYLSAGTNSISVTITGRNTLASSMAAVTYTVVNLELSSNFAFSTPVEKGAYLHVPYTLKGANVKYMEWYLDGVKLSDVDTVVGLNVNGTKNIDTTGMTVGKHNIQARAFITENGTNYYSDTLYFDFLVRPAIGEWESNVTHVLLGVVIDAPLTSGSLSVNVRQYETFEYSVAVYDSRNRSLSLVITDNGNAVKSIAISDASIISESYTPTMTGSHTILLTCDGQTASFTAVAQASDIDINEETSDVLLKLSAKGRTNNESNPAVWTFQQAAAQGGNLISTTFTGFSWNAKSGWNNDALVIPAGASIQIGLNPLAGNPITKGRTIEIDFETSKVDDETASIVNLMNGSAGLSVTASTAKLQTAGGTKVENKFRDGDRIRLAFIINRTDDTDNLRMLYIVNNGILERASQFAANDTIGISGSTLTIGSTGCTVKLYSVSVYDKPLQVDQAFQNYAINNPGTISIASFNDIFDGNGAISVDKVNAHIPVMIITGDISSIMSISDKSHKNDWNTNPVDIEFRNMQNPEMNFFIDDADIRLQGTSSISYPRKNFRIYSQSKSGKYQTKLYTPTHNNEDLAANGKYSFKENAAPVSCWCLKADFAESSGSHNTGVARLWNSVMKSVVSNGDYILRTNAQKWAAQNDYDYDVRTTIDGFPIVLFQRDSENSPLICLGQYNFNNDKSTEDVFGFTALSKEGVTPFDNSHVECWEVLDSDNSIALFTDVSNFDNSWGNAFEARYPDKNKNVTALKAVAEFLNSCYDSVNDTVDVATWQAGKASHFDLPKLAAYYVYLLRFGAVDQTVKNAMFTTEDGVHWFYINYDNDTVLGIDNESHQFDTWDYGLFTQTPQGGYYYAGKGKSVLWRLFEADSECMALARQIDALLFSAGLTYEKVLEMFDDKQSSQWCERIYNENGRYKYISQALQGQNVLHMLQGSRKSHRHWWLQHRFEKYDNVFGNGTYSVRSIQARATGTVNIPQGAAYKFTPAITTYFGYAVASTTVDAPTERTAGVEVTATGLPQETGVGNLIYIYNANNIGAIDLSAYISALGSLNIGDAIDVNGDSRLTKLILGDGENTNAYLTAISGLSAIKSLEEIDIRGYEAITSMDLSTLVNLDTFKATGSGLTSFAPANGVILTSAVLPATIQSIALNGADVTAITYTPTTTLRSVELRNVTGAWSTKAFVNSWLALLSNEELSAATLALSGIAWTDMTVAQVIRMGKVGTKDYLGRVTIASSETIDEEGYAQMVSYFGEDAFTEHSPFRIIMNAVYLIQGKTEMYEGEEVQYSIKAIGGTSGSWQFNIKDVEPVEETVEGKTVTYYETDNVRLYSDGRLVTTETNVADKTFKLQCNDGVRLREKTVTVKKRIYPSSLTVTGDTEIYHNTGVDEQNVSHEYVYAIELASGANMTPVRYEASTTFPSTVATASMSGCSAVLNVAGISDDLVTGVVRVTAVFETGRMLVGESATIAIQNDVVIITEFSNPEVMAYLSSKGLSQSSYEMRASEARNVKRLEGFSGFNITSFVELKYFTELQYINLDGLTNLTSIYLSTKLTIAPNFSNCPNLKEIHILDIDEFARLSYSGNYMAPFRNGAKLYLNGELVKDVVLTKYNVGNYVFYNNSHIETVTIFGVDNCRIGTSSFMNCVNLKSVTLGDGVTSIRGYAFSECRRLGNVLGGSGLYSIDIGCFRECTNLTTIESLGDVISIKSEAFYDCSRLSSIDLSNIQYINSGAFMGCSAMRSVSLPEIRSIDYEAFFGCIALKNISIGKYLSVIDNKAFAGCSSLETITVDQENSVYDSRNGCDAIIETSSNTLLCGAKNTVIPNTVTKIGDFAFYGRDIISITIPESVTEICSFAFNECKSLASVTIPDSVTKILDFVFQYCNNLTSVSIGSGVTSIGLAAFYGCPLVLITSYPLSAPTIQENTFSIPSTTPSGRRLVVKSDATGYDASFWQTQLQDTYGFTLEKTL